MKMTIKFAGKEWDENITLKELERRQRELTEYFNESLTNMENIIIGLIIGIFFILFFIILFVVAIK